MVLTYLPRGSGVLLLVVVVVVAKQQRTQRLGPLEVGIVLTRALST